MKKTACLILALLLLLAASACKPAASVEEATPSPTVAASGSPSSAPVAAPAYTPVPAPTPVTFPAKGYCNGEGVNLRAEPATSANVLDILGENVAFDVMSLQEGWYMVHYEGLTAYIKEDLVTLGEPPRPHNMRWAKVSVPEAQLYKSLSETDLSEVKLKEGDLVKVLRAMNGYLHIVYNGTLQRYMKENTVTFITAEEAAALMTPAPGGEGTFPTPADTPKPSATP